MKGVFERKIKYCNTIVKGLSIFINFDKKIRFFIFIVKISNLILFFHIRAQLFRLLLPYFVLDSYKSHLKPRNTFFAGFFNADSFFSLNLNILTLFENRK